ncbi:MAG: guanylyltransferase [Clostridiales bacterium]|nr:guanylyltransferase [Clostridiales bacterium]
MNFEELDLKMRKYEQSIDQTVLPELYITARIDGRNFSRLTKEICDFEAPFDEKFRDMMVETVRQLMQCGFRVIYGFTESDEISLLFHPDENAFGRKVRKYNSILASQAGAAFSLQLGMPCAFDCRLIPLPTTENVVDYFQWRQEDAHRNALNAHCYWLLRKQGKSAIEATKQLEGKNNSYKNELLFENGINFNDLPDWQKRGVGLYYNETEKTGFNPVKNCEETATRNEIFVDYTLPVRQEYSDFILAILSKNS